MLVARKSTHTNKQTDRPRLETDYCSPLSKTTGMFLIRKASNLTVEEAEMLPDGFSVKHNIFDKTIGL